MQPEHVSTQTSYVKPEQVSTQTSFTQPVQMSTQTPFTQPAHMSTQTSQVASVCQLSIQTSNTQASSRCAQESFMKNPTAMYGVMSDSASSHDFNSKDSAVGYKPSVSDTDPSSLQDTYDRIDSLQQDAEILNRQLHADMLDQEEEALRARLQYELELQRKSEK